MSNVLSDAGKNLVTGIMDGFKSLFGVKLTKDQYKEVEKKVEKSVSDNEKKNGYYNPVDPLVKDTPFQSLADMLNILNQGAKDVLAIPKYVLESAKKNPQTATATGVLIVGLLYLFKGRK